MKVFILRIRSSLSIIIWYNILISFLSLEGRKNQGERAKRRLIPLVLTFEFIGQVPGGIIRGTCEILGRAFEKIDKKHPLIREIKSWKFNKNFFGFKPFFKLQKKNWGIAHYRDFHLKLNLAYQSKNLLINRDHSQQNYSSHYSRPQFLSNISLTPFP